MRRSKGVSEVVSSVSMLAITIAVLGAVGLVSLGSLRSANAVLSAGSQNAASADGVLLSLISTQQNSSGTYVWLFNYGWTAARLSDVYVDGGRSSGWTSTCSLLQPKDLCYLRLAPATHGEVSIQFGVRTIAVAL